MTQISTCMKILSLYKYKNLPLPATFKFTSEVLMDIRTCFLSVIFNFLLSSTIFSLTCSAQKNITNDQSALNAFKAHIALSDPSNILSLLWSNKIPACKWEGVSCSIRHQRVTALDLSYMNLTATISPHLGNLSFLSSLILKFNNFHGFLPVELANLRRLQQLHLQFNNLSGEVPMWLGNFQHLKEVILSNNSFTGLISSSMFNISSMRVLRLEANDFFGSLPENICDNLPHLETFSVAINRLHGQTPANLYNCTRLQILSLSYNQFSGSISRQIGNLTDLRELYLGFNNFKGMNSFKFHIFFSVYACVYPIIVRLQCFRSNNSMGDWESCAARETRHT